MLLLTIVSRAADAVTIPQVKTEGMKRDVLQYSLSGEGTLAATSEQVFFLPAGGKPEEITPAGTAVSPGDVLVRFSMEDLQKKLETAEGELQKLELSKKQEALGGQPAAQAREQDAAGRNVSQIYGQLTQAQAELQNRQNAYNALPKQVTPDETEDQRGTENQGGDGGSATDDLSEAERQAQQQAQEAERKAQQDLEAERQALEAEIGQWQETVKSLEQSLQDAQNALADAKVNDANTAKNNQRQQDISALTQQSIDLDIETKQQEITKWNDLIAAEGQVIAEKAGTIKETTATLGTETSGAEYVKLGTGSGKMTAQVDKDEVSWLKVQDAVTVNSSDGKTELKGTVESLQEEEEGKILLTAAVEESELPIGTKVTFQANMESEEYGCVIPLRAIREDSKGKYVLVIKEENTILGKEKKAARVDVKILQKDDSSAAVESALLSGDEIIVDSNKSIKEGDRVRMV